MNELLLSRARGERNLSFVSIFFISLALIDARRVNVRLGRVLFIYVKVNQNELPCCASPLIEHKAKEVWDEWERTYRRYDEDEREKKAPLCASGSFLSKRTTVRGRRSSKKFSSCPASLLSTSSNVFNQFLIIHSTSESTDTTPSRMMD